MRIIDLLNKIANGEEVPKKIKINNIIYEYRGYMYCTEKANYQDIEDYLFGKWNFNILNDTVEIPEEENKIKHIGKTYDITDFKKEFPEAACLLKDTSNKLYEIIDETNKLKENK